MVVVWAMRVVVFHLGCPFQRLLFVWLQGVHRKVLPCNRKEWVMCNLVEGEGGFYLR